MTVIDKPKARLISGWRQQPVKPGPSRPRNPPRPATTTPAVEPPATPETPA
jgi:hypothetical protein